MTSFWFCSVGSSMPHQSIFLYLIPVLIGILGANVQGTTEPIFITHALNMWSFLVFQAMYCFALATDIESLFQQENSTNRSGIIAITSGSLSAISLVSTFLQGSTGHIILYVSWACAVVIVVYHQYGRLFVGACLQVYHDTLNPIFTHIWNWFQAFCLQLYHDTLKPFSAYMWNWFRASCLQIYDNTLKPLSTYIWNWFRASCLQLYHDTLNPFFTSIWNWFQVKENIFSTEQQGPQAEV